MAFNHYAKLVRLIDAHPGWTIRRIDKPTKSTNFKGETVRFDAYYRLYDADDQPIKYGKFQQIDRLAQALRVPVEALPIRESSPSEPSSPPPQQNS